jgi:CubicO group peptidase (beta-lactamase class C family)
VAKDGRIVYAKGVGMADLEHDAPITPQTPFYLASVAKQFTAYAVTRLASGYNRKSWTGG